MGTLIGPRQYAKPCRTIRRKSRRVRRQTSSVAKDTMSNCDTEIEALSKLLSDANAELESATDERERHALEVYCEYLEARLARLRAQPGRC